MKRRILLLLTERSTYTGLIAALSSMAALGLPEEVWQQIATVIAAVSGLIMAFSLEKGDKEKL